MAFIQKFEDIYGWQEARMLTQEFARFLGIARRSAVEVQSLLYVALDVGYINQAEFQQYYAQAATIKGLIGALKHSLRTKPTRTITNQRHLTPDT